MKGLKKAIIVCFSSLVQRYSSLESRRAAREAMRVAQGLSLAALVKNRIAVMWLQKNTFFDTFQRELVTFAAGNAAVSPEQE